MSQKPAGTRATRRRRPEIARSGHGTARRADAERNRGALIAVAARQLQTASTLEMGRLAADAGVSRSTLYRHFPSTEAVRRGVVERALADARVELHAVTTGTGPPLAILRRAVSALVTVGASYPLERVAGRPLAKRPSELVRELLPLVERLCELAGLDPAPPRRLVEAATAHLIETSLRAAADSPNPAAEAGQLFATLTEPLDQGLVMLDADGGLLAVNRLGREALALEDPKRGQHATNARLEAVYEDGSHCPADGYPLARAVATAETQIEAVRGHRDTAGTLRWFTVAAIVLRHTPSDPPYAVVGIFSDVTAQRHAELVRLHPPGTLGSDRPVPLDVARVLDEVPAHLLPDQLVAEARRLVRVPVALYVVDIDGTNLLRVAGADEFPRRLEAPLALGPELAPDGLPELQARLEADLPGLVMTPMWLRGRAVGVLLALRGPPEALTDLARQGAQAMELANGYTDVFDATRRRKEINPAAEIQQSLLPPRIAPLGGGEIAGGVLPSYEVGGDWFDYVENRDGAWIAIADAAGRGPHAAALGSVGLAALRAARRNDASLEEAVQTIHETICDAASDEFFLTAIVARWSPVHSTFSWVNAGHPAPLLLDRTGRVEELTGARALPLGILDRRRRFRRNYRRLGPGDRVILYTDGISRRPTANGFFGCEGITQAARATGPGSATAIARSIQKAVVGASEQQLRDDAVVLVLAPASE